MKQSLKVTFKRFDTSLPVPEYKTKGAAAFDLYAREETVIKASSIGYIPLNIALQLPEDHWALVSARSSLHKRGLMLANGIGVGDYDYRGPNDEYKAAVFNFTGEDVVIERAERVVQMIILKRPVVELSENDSFEDADRGGFGTTGRK
ncbi:MAG: dUTP diphosphatase [Candidatus Pacebacteria bacterium CG_4_9_14_3_um_filter_40_12]|nr:MAG: dUTP diphosphatase [Candidatus Pacebacteria bacterium CG10_big_fil_rev_8_21_14_0_10_40_26]PIZ79159.1 MAG: dUTP diphosphatase [Candidatus Pacebacteria bacterium CG_4_10_14_0_2_um_filter_40_20]PJA68814.1 MAG: dUTP diphosphatase [Candidatus Pacebacteria bacterium CG_4_9_14_3_um_filter_40_12]PJC42125.1 MAG: dUTP diphosphatase [Candidatus Pacebacteria bacterium CG_4_9_14_0_2_um_filter_40_15]